ncbi:Alpha-galactosidase, NPCBM associated NEW3 domain-containing protein [Gemmatirosa kalamazoonensis]|uniref:Alpha-galactosidase, NPCBM associated NEW3 domain-containing protein n=1 Tax=Gemmatirosa kalamazoonensis TaxID=861299 RepID=W0RJZ6_9BACT|nr:NEW3 domain-containing protein [Gemmatirosa kalamazoonensis]AHG91419.1 Alpha-galactosidase, NPCBM associated NEW3 domain-containing protein [Gemmatirosa kalamazoonensis]
MRCLFMLLGCAVLAVRSAHAQTSAEYLDVLRTRSDVERTAGELARADALLRRAMLSPSEHEARRADYVRARLAYVGALLAASGARAHLTIARAVKSRTADGRLRVVLTLRNESAPLPVDVRAPAVDSTETASPELDASELAAITTVRGAVVALKTDVGAAGAVVSRPYERIIDALRPGESRDVSFELLADLADAVIAVDAGGRVEERRIRLEVGAAANVIGVQASQSSLEGDLGAQVVYDLRLQRSRPRAVPTRLVASGLPPDLAVEFRDPDTRTRLGQLRFPDGANTARVQLAVSLPARPSSAVRPDAPLAFDVVATDESDGADVAQGSARLELVPRGVARLALRPATLALQASADTVTPLALVVRNTGTGRVTDVRLRVEAPPRWQVSLAPASIPAVAPGDERRVAVQLLPPRDAAGGDYELRIGVDDASSARRIEVEDKLVRVRVPGDGGTGALVGVLGLAALLAMAVAYGRRWVTR